MVARRRCCSGKLAAYNQGRRCHAMPPTSPFSIDDATTLLDTSGTGDLTPLAAALPAEPTQRFAGARTALRFSDISTELTALRESAGVSDLGWRTRLRITGEDRVRWLNGMVTNTVKDLKPGQLNYAFLLNAQGRIQGDAHVYALPNSLFLVTDQAQISGLQQHLDHFIIMDDVELAREEAVTALGLRGPRAAGLLSRLYPQAEQLEEGQLLAEGQVLLACEGAQSYTIWLPEADVLSTWQQLLATGATPCGIETLETFRVLTGVPRYGADIHEKSLAQETDQARALNFSKGCYLGQEIVERVRSRATIHRMIRVFALEGEIPAPGTALTVADKPDTPVGELTSVATVSLPNLRGQYALGTVRSEAAKASLLYAGGHATVLAHPPLQLVER